MRLDVGLGVEKRVIVPRAGITLAYREFAANGAGDHLPSVILLTASPGDSRDFEDVAGVFASWGHQVLALDWPGYGASEPLASPGAASVAVFYAIFCEFMEAIAIGRPCVLVGNSIGGYSSLRYAAEHPDKVAAVIAVSPGGFTPQTVFTRAFCRFMGSRWALSPRFLAGLYLKRRTSTVAAMLSRAASEQSSASCRAQIRSIWRSFSLPESLFLAPPAAAMTAAGARVSLDAIKCPVLLVFGAYDSIISHAADGAQARRMMPRAEYVLLRTGHAPFAEDPKTFLEAVRPFLAKL
jgi:pimeloyl-ACP methyl ester carboxylesterase